MVQKSRGTDRAARNAKKLKNALREQGVEVKLSQVEKAFAELGNVRDFNTLIGATRNTKSKLPGEPTNIICRQLGPYSEETQSWPNQSQWTVFFIDATLAAPKNILYAGLFDQSQDEKSEVERIDPDTGKKILNTPFALHVTITLELAEYVLTRKQESTLSRCYDRKCFAEAFSGFVVDNSAIYDEHYEGAVPSPFNHYTITIPLSKKPAKADINWVIEQVARYHHRECQRIISENQDTFTRLLHTPKPGDTSLTFPVHTDNCGHKVGWVTLPDFKASWGIFRENPPPTSRPSLIEYDQEPLDLRGRCAFINSNVQKIAPNPTEVEGERLGYLVDLERHGHYWKVVTQTGGSVWSGISPRREGEIGDWFVVEAPGIKIGPNPITEARTTNPFDDEPRANI